MNVRGKRNIGRRILAVALSVCMLLTVQPNLWDGVMVQAAEVVQSGTLDGTNLTWTLDANGVLTITGTGAMNDYAGQSTPPWYEKRSSISIVIIDDGVTSIGERVFNRCSSLRDVTIPDSVTSIGEAAFYGCSRLWNVTIPDSVTSIGRHAFYGCISLRDVTIPNGVTSLEPSVFSSCSSLTSVEIPNGVTSIGDGAFTGCRKLTGVTIPSSVTSIGEAAFYGCSSLTSVTIPGSVTSIGKSAFNGCSSLTGVTIPGSVTSIGIRAFNSCSRLMEIVVEEGNSKYDSRDHCNAIIDKDTNELVAGCGATSIPESVTSIGEYAFYGCSSLTGVTIPGSVTSIGEYAFYGCSSLTGVTIPSSVTSLEKYVFYRCSSLTSVTIPSSVTSIGERAFDSCSKLTSVTIPGSVTSIGNNAFYSCSKLTSVRLLGQNPPTIGTYIFTRCGFVTNKERGIHVPWGTEHTYNEKWSDWKDYIKDRDAVKLNGNDGSGTALTEYTYGTTTSLPTDWTKTGYVFDGWYGNADCSGAEVKEISDTATGDKEYWAKWTDNIAPVIGTITYNDQPKNLWQWLIGKDSLVITVPVTEEGSGADEITYTETPDGGTAETKTANITGGEAKITIDADFKGTVSIVCTDKAGNTSAGVTVGAGIASNGIIIEDNAPQIAFQAVNAELLNAGEYKTAPDITVTVADDKDNAISGGIASISYKIGNGSEKTVAHDYTTSMVMSDSFTIPAGEIPGGETKITVTATDNAGNSNTQDYTVKVHTHSGTLVPAVEPACTTAGNITYYTCSCGKWFSDSGCTNEITDHTTVIRNALGHDYTWTIKAPNMTAEVTATGVCKNDNSHTETKTLPALTDTTAWTAGDKTEPKKDTDGSQTYTSQYGTVTVTFPSYTKIVEKVKAVAEDTLKKVTATNHTTKENIQNEIHTVLTNAGIQDVTVTVEDLTIIEATSSAAGSISGNIMISSGSGNDRVTDHVSINMTIAKLTEGSGSSSGSSDSGTSTPQPPKNTGTITKDVEKTDTAPDTRISGNEAELADILLTTEEKSKVENGTDIRVILDIKDAQNLVDSSDQAVVEETLSGSTSVQGYDVGQYLDVSLYKVVGTERTAISETSKKIRIVIQLPDALKSKDSGTSRTFAVIRVHSGAAEVLKDLDDDADTITIETDRFSAYVIVYKEGAAAVKPDTKPAKNASAKEKRNSQLHSGLKAFPEGNMLQISWGSVSGADGYDVYVQYCGKKFNAGSRSVVKGGKKTTFTINKVNGKAVDTKKKIKIYVVAWQQKNGKKTTLAKSLTMHIAGKDDAAYTNVKRIQVKKSSYTLEKGKDVTLAPTAVLYDKKKKQLSNNHAKEFRYLSSNQNVATVTAGGKVKAKGIGSCTIYIIARNGCSKKIQITVTE